MLIRIDTQLAWQIARDPKSNRWVGVCSALAITAEAETWAKLTALLAEEVNELLLDLFNEGELQKFLPDRGWRPLIRIPGTMPREGLNFDVPMEITVGTVANLSAKSPSHAQA
jgi:hypothetical protein